MLRLLAWTRRGCDCASRSTASRKAGSACKTSRRVVREKGRGSARARLTREDPPSSVRAAAATHTRTARRSDHSFAKAAAMTSAEEGRGGAAAAAAAATGEGAKAAPVSGSRAGPPARPLLDCACASGAGGGGGAAVNSKAALGGGGGKGAPRARSASQIARKGRWACDAGRPAARSWSRPHALICACSGARCAIEPLDKACSTPEQPRAPESQGRSVPRPLPEVGQLSPGELS